MPKLYGYMRVSTKEQNEERQRVALINAGVPENMIYMDKLSGKDFERPQYQKLIKKLDKNSVLFVKSIDRLGRNYIDLNEQWRIITKEKGADIVVIDMPLLDTRREKNLLGTLISDIVLALLSYVAESERINIKQRQAEGIAIAKANGVKFGRPRMPIPDNFYQLRQEWRNGKISMKEAAKECNMPIGSFYSRAVRIEKEVKNEYSDIITNYGEALKTAIFALEKQIPKSPDYEGDGYSEGKLVYDTWICPNCGEHYEVGYDNYDYCPNCGQHIQHADWESK